MYAKVIALFAFLALAFVATQAEPQFYSAPYYPAATAYSAYSPYAYPAASPYVAAAAYPYAYSGYYIKK